MGGRGTELYLRHMTDNTMIMEAWTAGHEEEYKWAVHPPTRTFRSNVRGKVDTSSGHYAVGQPLHTDRFTTNAHSDSERWIFANVATTGRGCTAAWLAYDPYNVSC